MLVMSVVVSPDDVTADHAALLFVTGVVGAVEGEVAQGGELASIRLSQELLVGV
ncbi:hypothetical protein JOF59_006050 [Streptomyces clavifer]|uniref:Uncharacterized protein n=1 Tax=Streptomyces clavifer TaxID=68188 RepID=A0ABS4VI03_9ACTN|nr:MULTISPECIES: hypothetical protein [unclassified Streptomyces]MBP2363558.1 hypothetical protein [Streptomyces clavifer]MDX2748464.1 hypothetical protein [Streptomyces sp. NRRL_B-2557]WRY86965.1 hypothetical protein OG388_00920 [Streptomyces clavifer]WRY86980.1 hypothetical protein OG388_37070 [Streptomyces clavifer]